MKKTKLLSCILAGFILWFGIAVYPIYGDSGSSGSNTEEEKPKESLKVWHIYPQSHDGQPSYNEKALTHTIRDNFTEGKYFLRVSLGDADGNISLSSLDNFKNCVVRSVNGSTNMIDMEFINHISQQVGVQAAIDKYLLVKSGNQATLYIPVRPLMAQTIYQVIIPPLMVYDTNDPSRGNEPIEWDFATIGTPLVTEVTLGSIPQDYDDDEPIYLYGDFFDSDSIAVFFNDIEADYVEIISPKELKVYLPEGRHVLRPGIYDIIVQNDKDHQQILHGSLSVVEPGYYIPHEDYKIKDEIMGGQVRGAAKLSEDTLHLDSFYSNEKHVTLYLDQWMGDDVWTRNIKYFGTQGDYINKLETKSKWADITLYDITLEDNADDYKIHISLGRAEPALEQTLRQKLRGRGIQSDFIQISGENYKHSYVDIKIPLKTGGLENIQLLFYDEDLRAFYPINFRYDKLNQCVEATSTYRGIFVVVEN